MPPPPISDESSDEDDNDNKSQSIDTIGDFSESHCTIIRCGKDGKDGKDGTGFTLIFNMFLDEALQCSHGSI
jgi:hypothetical protein